MDASQSSGSKTAWYVWIVGAPILFTIGTFGNLLTIVVLQKSRTQRTSTSLYLSILAGADLGLIVFALPRWWLIKAFGFEIRSLSPIVCKLHFYLIYVCSNLSTTSLVVVTLERLISTLKPHSFKSICTFKSSIIIALAYTACVVVWLSHILYGFDLHDILVPNLSSNSTACPFNNVSLNEQNLNFTNTWSDSSNTNVHSDVHTCYSKVQICSFLAHKRYSEFYVFVFQYINMLTYNAIPMVTFFISGVIIIHQLSKRRRQRQRNFRKNLSNGNVNNQAKSDKFATQITLMLLLIIAVFFLCTTPAMIYLLGRTYWVHGNMTELQEILWAVVNILFYTNHCVNFILYFLSGQRFRQQVFELLCKQRRRLKLSAVSLVPSISEQLN